MLKRDAGARSNMARAPLVFCEGTMQTFLPLPSFAASAAALDWRRLGNQRIEAKVIVRVLLGEVDGWRNHPAVRMWRGHLGALLMYGLDVCAEWRRRGYRDRQLEWFGLRLGELHGSAGRFGSMPSWLGRGDFHASHRAALLAKDPEWYGQFGWAEDPAVRYVWPA